MWLGIEIRSKRSLLRLAAAIPKSEVWVCSVYGGEDGGVSPENLRKLNCQLLSQVSLMSQDVGKTGSDCVKYDIVVSRISAHEQVGICPHKNVALGFECLHQCRSPSLSSLM